jgi:hypothetical protein
VARIVYRYQWEIWIDAEVSKGEIFYFTITESEQEGNYLTFTPIKTPTDKVDLI